MASARLGRYTHPRIHVLYSSDLHSSIGADLVPTSFQSTLFPKLNQTVPRHLHPSGRQRDQNLLPQPHGPPHYARNQRGARLARTRR